LNTFKCTVLSWQYDIPVLGEGTKEDSQTSYASVTYRGVTYAVGDCAYFDPNSFDFSIKSVAVVNRKNAKLEVNDVSR